MFAIRGDVWIDAPKDQVWSVLSDLEAVQEYDAVVPHAHYTSEIKQGVGASRHCDLLPMGEVEERCTEWINDERMTLEIYEARKLPMTGRAKLVVEPENGGTAVQLDMEIQGKGGPLAGVVEAMMRGQVRKLGAGLLNGLKHHIETGEAVTPAIHKKIEPAAVLA